ncbi:MAG: pentapeptide repeat-containing protein [Cyanobacteria bacterium J06635_1]
MKAQDVLNRYAQGERNFSGANLRGANFKGQDLSGADFSGADIRGANFTNAILQSACFKGATAGLQKRWVVGQWVLVAVISALAGVLEGLAGGVLALLLFDAATAADLIAGIVGCVVIVILLLAIARQGFTLQAFGTIAIVIAVGLAIAFAGVVAFEVAFAGVVTFEVAGVVAFASAVAAAFAIAVGLAIAIAIAIAIAVAGAVAGMVAGAVAIAVAFAGVVAFNGAVAGAVAIAVAVAVLSFYVARHIRKWDEKFAVVRTFGIAFGALGGTSFSGVDLSGANFSQARLKSTNFAASRKSSTSLNRVCWQDATLLDRSRLGNAILQNPKVRDLLITFNGRGQNLSDLNLRGANLHSADLKGAHLKRATISAADFSRAILEDANLSEAQAVGTDFTHAYLTGATLEAWNIDSTTVLKDIDCRYIFLRERPNQLGDRERRPHDPNKTFQPGDFEKFFKEVLDEVQILIRNGVNPDAFRAALQRIMEENPDITRDSVKAIEKQGDDVLLTLQVAEGTDKAKVERDWDTGYQAGLKAGREAGRLEAETRRADDIKEIALLIAQKPINVEANIEANAVSDSRAMQGSDQSQNINVKGDFNINAQNSVVSLRDVSGQVTNQINQLGGADTQLKDLLTQLQTAIETEPTLADDDKAEALEQVKTLAEAGQAPTEGKMQKVAKRAMTMLKGITSGLTETTKLVEVCNQLLPAIGLLFGL